jgi:hypothetical protein
MYYGRREGKPIIDENLIVTTPEEIEGLHIVRAILRDVR